MYLENFSFSFFLMIIITIIISILITQYIWNAIMPDIFSVGKITFWQTLGLLILTNIFLGGQCGIMYNK